MNMMNEIKGQPVMTYVTWDTYFMTTQNLISLSKWNILNALSDFFKQQSTVHNELSFSTQTLSIFHFALLTSTEGILLWDIITSFFIHSFVLRLHLYQEYIQQ